MAEAIVGPLLSKLKDVALTEAKALAAVGGEIETLSDKLMWLQALVHEADLRSRHDGSRLIRVLAWQIRDVAFEAEDAVDEFYLKGDLSRRFALAQRFGRNWARAAMECIVHFRTHFCVRFALSGRIQSMNARLEEIINNSSKYGMSHGSSIDGMTWRASRYIPLMRDHWENSVPFKLIGRKDEKANLIQKLTQHGSGVVIRVVGPAGMGKTAFLKDACEDASIKNHFHVVVHMSFVPRGTSVSSTSLKQTIEEQVGKACSWGNESRQQLCCLVVIDGLTTTIRSTMWSEAEAMLQQMTAPGSKILLTQTSQHEQPQMMDDDGATIRLRNLGPADSRALFNHVVGLGGRRRSDYATVTMNEIRDNIEAITHGAPLAVVLLAKFMSTVPYSKWSAASEYIKRNREDDSLKTILSVCMDDLPDELKSCLLYTAGLPDKTHIEARKLVRLWMAEGFLTQNQGLEAEQLGQCYLKELVYRGLLQLIHKTSSADGGRVESVALHEQIHPLVRQEARRTSFMDVHYGGSVQPPANTRRLAHMYKYDHDDKKLFSPPTTCLAKLRSVVSYSRDDHDDDDTDTDHENVNLRPADADDHKEKESILTRKLLRGSPFLRVIHLEEGLDNLPQLPDEIGEMVHLHYLGLRCRSLTRLPSSIGNLGRLQTVDVRGTGVKELPKSLWKIPTLRHVLGRGLSFPRSTRDLKLLQTLETITIQDFHTGCMDIFGRRKKFAFRFLHRLGVVELTESQQNDLATILKELSYLESLSLRGTDIPINMFANANCLDNVASMELHGKLPPLQPHLVARCLSNLTRLVLRHTEINQDFLNDIAKLLPNLAELEMGEKSYEGTRADLCSQRFSSLLVLRITGLVTLEHVTVPGITTARNKAIVPIFSYMQKIHYEDHQSCSLCNPMDGQQAIVEQHPPPAAANTATGGRQAAVEQHPPPAAANTATAGQGDDNGGDRDAQLGNEQSLATTGGEATEEAAIYCEMILEAIRVLDRRHDSTNKKMIVEYIRQNNNGHIKLPPVEQLRLVINEKLDKMVESRQLIKSGRWKYLCADPQH